MKIRSFLRKWIDRISIIKQYFLRGHNSWFALAFTLINFTLIFYDLLFVDLYFIPPFLKSYFIFVIVFGALYFPLATFVGYFDMSKGTFSAEQNLHKELSPVWKEVFNRLSKIEADNKLIIDLLSEKKN
jgi:hypothetical protein